MVQSLYSTLRVGSARNRAPFPCPSEACLSVVTHPLAEHWCRAALTTPHLPQSPDNLHPRGCSRSRRASSSSFPATELGRRRRVGGPLRWGRSCFFRPAVGRSATASTLTIQSAKVRLKPLSAPSQRLPPNPLASYIIPHTRQHS